MEAKEPQYHHLLRFFLSTRFEHEGTEEKPVMSSELHRNQVTDAQSIEENLRDAAYHEAGHVVVARFLGLTVRKVEIEEDGSGRADIRYAEHLPLVDQIAVCVAGIVAQELFNCPMHDHAAFGDYRKFCELMAGLTDAESYEYRYAAYLRALEILKRRLPEIEELADQLLEQRRIAA
jgi:hypothetical protein